jgi:hypothetical protein
VSQLAEFLLARIAEDHSAAFFAQQDEQLMGSLADQAVARGDHRGTHAHRWSPARVLAECEAKRRIVEVDWRADDSGEATLVQQDVLRLLALPYADHPDYRPEWRP